MIVHGIALKIIIFFQTLVGVMGNSFLLGLYIITFFAGPRLRTIDMILTHLAFVNNLVLLSKGIPQIMAALGLNNFLDDIGCKFVFFFHRVSRGLSLCTTSFLSGFQAITISPESSRWAKIKPRVQKYTVPFWLFCWVFRMASNGPILIYMKGPQGHKNTTSILDFGFCSVLFNPSLTTSISAFLIFLPDAICLIIMIWASSFMVLVLYRHRQRVQYIHSSRLFSRPSLETRATQSILILVSIFVYCNLINSVLTVYVQFAKTNHWLLNVSSFLAACFPACSPFVLIFSDSQVSKYCLTIWEKIKPPSITDF
ncbi:vomeronasal 1 receptor monDomV1R1249 [Monodelphis domestica]|uniref:vomeronasal 1 receptor monDomV1R1249 n=1 Tax=Monodelphis domestica TaxID=13616 RepID=UPI0001C47964|nr:vomeronasal 1 receptor monDomV1R1249 [Monodelphis domestica]